MSKRTIREFFEYRFFLIEFVKRLITLRYRRTILGYFWALLNPLLSMAIISLVFSNIYNLDLKEFAIYFFSGVIVFNFFKDSVMECSNSFIQNEAILSKIYIPKFLFPLSYILFTAFDNVLMAFSLLSLVLLLGGKIGVSILILPISSALLLLFSTGIGLVVSIVSVYLRDLPYLIGVFFQGLLFLSPVFIKPTVFSSKINILFKYNPLTYFIDLFRSPIYENSLPESNSFFICTILAFFSFNIGLIFFSKFNKNIPLIL